MQFELTTGQSLAVTGPNGSGKTTLLMTLLSLYRPSRGQVVFSQDGKRLDDSRRRAMTSLVAPYLNLYDQLSAEENLKFIATLTGHAVTGKQLDTLLARVGLQGRGCDPVGEYSSGMKQRLKYAVALLKEPAFMFLDEPSTNLDEEGRQLIRSIIEEYRSRSMIVIATNDPEESRLAQQQLRLGS
ncbi:MAG: ATP-binding cassette domain-containing protein [bacterium]